MNRWNRRQRIRQWLCEHGLHWPIKWDEQAWPASYDPPHPPEPDFCCQWCGHRRLPYRAWWWNVKGWWYR